LRILTPFPANDPAPMKKFGKALLALLVLLLLVAALFLYWPLTQRSVPAANNDKPVDVVLVGAGIMSITLATYLQELQPDWNIQVYERLDGVAGESSDGWNNAGTGHSAFAELNYTPELPMAASRPSARSASPNRSKSRASSGRTR
jgi:malate dehydrogenase (quinone)